MTAEDATAYTVLEVIIQRAYILGGINMSEHSTKFLTSLMLEVTGARSMLVSERKKWHSYLKAELKKLVRDREPLEYIVELPATPNLMQKEYPKQYAAAYPDGDVPIKVPSAFHADVMLLDGTYKCRGGNTKDGDTSDLTASLEALSRLVCFRQQEPRESTIPGLKFFEKPAGKPMRSLQNLCGHASLQDRRHAALRALTLPPIADVSPGGGEAQKEENTAQAEHQETEEEKENDPLEEENIDTQLYEKKEEAAPAAIVAVEKTEKDEKGEKDEKEADVPLASVAVGALIIRTRIVTMIIIMFFKSNNNRNKIKKKTKKKNNNKSSINNNNTNDKNNNNNKRQQGKSSTTSFPSSQRRGTRERRLQGKLHGR